MISYPSIPSALNHHEFSEFYQNLKDIKYKDATLVFGFPYQYDSPESLWNSFQILL